MSEFAYVPSYGCERIDQYAVKRAEFGDGYVATAPDGINPVKEVWRLPFDNIARTTGEAICTFLRGKAGAVFTWTPPDASEKSWRLVGDVSMKRSGPNTVDVSCVFEEAFGA